VRFTKLRLSGFKSFVDPTELIIDRGLTGIVGPNGCGKSNLVEALRWVMGETSAKQMRGSEMEDVIFGGTRDRPPRNIAEAILSIDNTERNAPSQFNHADELEVSRRIERGAGSIYRVNGKEARARDVQILFADAATGPRSTALVSQGRIGNLISAKPTERRLLIEEAAGITGLYSRRHEAEIRLRGAESNLMRLDDVLGTLDAQLKSLRKQARQASRYRNLSGDIRRAEATLFLLRWRDVERGLALGHEQLKEAEARVVQLTGTAVEASTRQAECAATMPPLRQIEVEAAAELQRLTLARQSLDEEERRVEAAVRDCQARLAQIAADIGRETSLADDAGNAIKALDAEAAGIDEARRGGRRPARRRSPPRRVTQQVEALDRQLAELTDKWPATRPGVPTWRAPLRSWPCARRTWRRAPPRSPASAPPWRPAPSTPPAWRPPKRRWPRPRRTSSGPASGRRRRPRIGPRRPKRRALRWPSCTKRNRPSPAWKPRRWPWPRCWRRENRRNGRRSSTR